MKGAVSAWQKSHGSEFLVRGLKLMDYIASQREEHKLLKDKEKNERVCRSHHDRQTATQRQTDRQPPTQDRKSVV